MPNSRNRVRKELENMIGHAVSELEAAHGLQMPEELSNNRDDFNRQVLEKMVKKDQVKRFKRYSIELSKFISSGFRVVIGKTQEEMLQQLCQIVEHVEALWNDAIVLFEAGSYSTAC